MHQATKSLIYNECICSGQNLSLYHIPIINSNLAGNQNKRGTQMNNLFFSESTIFKCTGSSLLLLEAISSESIKSETVVSWTICTPLVVLFSKDFSYKFLCYCLLILFYLWLSLYASCGWNLSLHGCILMSISKLPGNTHERLGAISWGTGLRSPVIFHC